MANVIEFTIRGIDAASGPLGKFSSTAATTVKTTAKFGAGILAASGAVTAFVSVINNSLDRHAKFAKRIGESVTELTAMQHAADLASIPIDQFNMATQRMTRRVAEAAQGTGEAVSALNELGINAKEFNNLGLQDRMTVLADRMGGVGSEADKLRLAFKLFDSEGTAMLQMLKDGSPAMLKAAKDAEYLGVVIGQQAAANAEEFSTQMARAQSSIKGVSIGISNELTPLMTGLTMQFTDMVAQARPAIVQFVKESISNIATLGVVISQVWDRISTFLDNIFTREGFDAFVQGAKASMEWVLNLFMNAGPIIASSLVGVFKLVWESFVELGKWGLDSLFDLLTGNDIAGNLSDVLFSKIPQATAETRAAMALMWEDLGEVATTEGTKISEALTDTFGINVDLARAQAAELVSNLEVFGTAAQEQMAATEAQQVTFLDAFYARNAEYMSKQQELMTELAGATYDLMMSTIDAVSNATAQAVIEGSSVLDALSAVGQQVQQQLIAMLVKMGIQRLVTAAITKSAAASAASSELAKGAATTYMNAFSSTAAIPIVGPGLAPGAAAAAQAAALSGAVAAGAAGAAIGPAIAGARQNGGPVQMGASYLVGERGPEIFTPNTNGGITANGGIGGGGVVIENLTISVLPNATNADALLKMSDSEMRDLVAEKFIPALDGLARAGTRPQYLMER